MNIGMIKFIFWIITAFLISGTIAIVSYIIRNKPKKHIAAGYIFCFVSLVLCLYSALVLLVLVSIFPNALQLAGF